MGIGKKLLWGGLGWAMGGPIGAILGYAFASLSEQMQGQPQVGASSRRGKTPRTRTGDFMASLLVLLAAVMKADGKLKKSELDYVKNFLNQQFNKTDAKNYVLLYKEILNQEYSLRSVCLQIKMSMDHPSRLQLMHVLFGISMADGQAHETEIKVIELISRYLNINPNDFASIKAMFVKSTKSAYQILEIDQSVSDGDVKKAYRKMAQKYHPDKVAHLGIELQNSAEEKFKAVNQAYKDVKLERGIN